MNLLRDILRIAVPLAIIVSYGIGCFALFVIVMCYTFPTRGFPRYFGAEWGILIVPLTILVEAFLIALFIVASKHYKHLWPKWVTDFFGGMS